MKCKHNMNRHHLEGLGRKEHFVNEGSVPVGFHEGMYQLRIQMPTFSAALPLGTLAWSSTWKSVLEIEHAQTFEQRYQEWTVGELNRRYCELRRRDWEIAASVTGAVFSLVAIPFGGEPLAPFLPILTLPLLTVSVAGFTFFSSAENTRLYFEAVHLPLTPFSSQFS